MKQELSPWERLEAVFAGRKPDHTPILGGWIASPDHISAITGISLEQYWENPVEASIVAYEKLGTDGLIDIYVPRDKDDFRCVDEHTYQRAVIDLSINEVLARIEDMPTPEEMERGFDFAGAYEEFQALLKTRQKQFKEMVFMPARWSAGARITWYAEFGYENFFTIVGLYPYHARKLLEIGGAIGRFQSQLVAEAVREGIYPHALLLGEDICSQRGPMISPDFMEKYYAPQLRYGLEPLLEVGCRPVWHSDGDIRPIMDMLIDCGIQGFQGFQPECGMTLDYVIKKRTRDGDKLLIFGPLSVTTELPRCSPEEIRNKIREAKAICESEADLVIFTANTINPDIPLDNIIAMYEAAKE